MRTAKVDWTDTATGKSHTTEVTTANGGTVEGAGRQVIAAAELDGRGQADRVRIDGVRDEKED